MYQLRIKSTFQDMPMYDKAIAQCESKQGLGPLLAKIMSNVPIQEGTTLYIAHSSLNDVLSFDNTSTVKAAFDYIEQQINETIEEQSKSNLYQYDDSYGDRTIRIKSTVRQTRESARAIESFLVQMNGVESTTVRNNCYDFHISIGSLFNKDEIAKLVLHYLNY